MKNALLYFTFLLISLFVFSCEATDPGDPPEVIPPEGYQEPVNWPSLADTPWPMYRHDPQLTGRSPFTGPTAGVISKTIPAPQMTSSIIIGYNSTLIYTYNGYLAACDFEGNEKWKLKLAVEISSTPLLGSDSTIYVTTGSLHSLVAVNLFGELKWEYKFDVDTWDFSVGIGKDNNIYLVQHGKMVVLNTSGELIWELEDNQFIGYMSNGFSFSPDGTQIYTPGNDVSLIAVDIISHSIAWTFGDQPLLSGAVIDNDGNIYILPQTIHGEKYLYCLTSKGKVKWKFKHNLNIYTNNLEPTIDKLGNIYFGREILYSLNHEGELNWEYDLGEYKISSSIVVDSENNLFIGTSSNYFQHIVMSININGKKNWELPITSESSLGLTLTITSNHELLVPTYDSYNFLIIN